MSRRTVDYDAVAAALRGGESQAAAARRFDVSKSTLSRIARQAGLKSGRHREVNHDYFEAIDSEEKAYWLGFLMADGCVCEGNKVSLGLAERDHLHVLRFRTAVGSTHALVRSGAVCKLSFRSAKMVADLARHNIVPRKSLTATPWEGSPELMRHYWRGAVDGDGHVSNGDTFGITLVGSRAVVRAFAGYARAACETRGNPRPNGEIWSMRVRGRAACGFARHLYEGATVALPRKSIVAAELAAKQFAPRPTHWPAGVTRDLILSLCAELRSWPAVAERLGVSLSTLIHFRVDRYGIRQEDTRRFRMSLGPRPFARS